MDERMTLERLVHEYRPTMDSEVLHSWAADMAAAVTAHLTQPAQAVDVGAVREVIASHRREIALCSKHDQESIDYLTEQTEKLTRAIGNAHVEGWTRAGTLNVQRWKGIDSMINTDFDYASDLPDGTYQLFTPTPPTQATPNAHE